MIDINKLIEVAESTINDEQIGFAAQITKPVQQITDKEGNIHELKIVLTMVEKNFTDLNN